MNIALPAPYRNTICVSALLLLSIAGWLPRLRGPLDLRFDAGVYYILGTSLAEGKGYRLLNEPGAIHAIQYPPLLSLIAAAHQRLAGDSDPASVGHLLRMSFFAMYLALIVAIYCLSRRYFKPLWAFLASLVTLLHFQTLVMSELFFAELPFALMSVLFLLAAHHRRGRSRVWLAGVLAVACFLLRGSGIALLGAWVGESLLKRQFGEMTLRASLALIPFLAWQGYISYVKSGAEYAQPAYEYQRAGYQFYNVGYSENLAYVDPFRPELGTASPSYWVKRVISNVVSMPESLGAAVSVKRGWASGWAKRLDELSGTLRVPAYFVDVVPFFVLGILVLAGVALLAIHAEWLLALYVVFSLALLCLTPWPRQFDRYLWPLTPVLAAALFTTLRLIKDRSASVHAKWKRIALVTVVAVVVVGVYSTEVVVLRKTYGLSANAFYETVAGERRGYRLFFYGQDWRNHDETLDWLERNADAGGIVATSTPHWVYLKTGLQSVMPPFEPDVKQAQRLMDSVPVRYLIVDSLEFIDVSRRYAAPVVEAFPERWELVYSSAQKTSVIYRRRSQEERVKFR